MNESIPQQYEVAAGGEMHPNVVAYRLGQVENRISEFSLKLDLIAQNYPTTMTIDLILGPIRASIIKLENERDEEERQKNNLTSQLKLAIVVAILSPLFSIVLTLLLTGKI